MTRSNGVGLETVRIALPPVIIAPVPLTLITGPAPSAGGKPEWKSASRPALVASAAM